jgi:hypothetical protein
MTGRGKTGRANRERIGLDRLAETLVEDILETPDAALLAEPDDEDGAASARAAFDRAVAASGRPRSAPRPRKPRPTLADIRALAPRAARRRLKELVARDPEGADELSAAARVGRRLSDEEVYGMLERFQERHAVERRHDGR